MIQDNSPAKTHCDEIAELLVHLGRAARAEAPVATGAPEAASAASLTPAQWTALRFFARANALSCTPSAFASFHVTTRGTATQTVKSLERLGYLTRRKALHDGRSVQFEVTQAGRDRLAGDPLRDLARAVARLEDDLQAALSRALPALAGAIADIRATNAFGTCNDCRHLAQGGSYCACVAADLAPDDLGRICARFMPQAGLRPGAVLGTSKDMT